MTEPTLYRSLLEELDARQNEALEELTRLEEAIDRTVAEWTKPKSEAKAA